VVHGRTGERTLVGHRKPAHLVHLITEEFHPDGVVLGGWENVQNAISCPTFNVTGTNSPRPATTGWTTARTGATTTRKGPAVELSGWASRRSTESLRPTVSERGESLSCGRVSQLGKVANESAGR
jgi:hypothetical protein